MHRKISVTFLTMLLIAVMYAPAAFAAVEDNTAAPAPAPGVERQVQLTDAQKKELKELYGRLLELKKQIVNKHLEFGTITKEQAERRIKRIEEMQKKIEQGDFTGFRGKGTKGHGKERKEIKPGEVQSKAETN